MAALANSLNFGLVATYEEQDLVRKRVSRNCLDGSLRLLERVTDDAALVPHDAVVLKGREIVGWAMSDYCAHADRLFNRGLDIVQEGGRVDPIESKVEFFVPASLKWRVAFFGDRQLPPSPFEIRKTFREPRKQERSSFESYSEHQEWDIDFAWGAETNFGGLRVSSIERRFGSRGADLGPQLIDRFLAPPYGASRRWWVASSTVQLEHAREEWGAGVQEKRPVRSSGENL